MLTIDGDQLVLEELAEYPKRTLKALVRAMNRSLGTGRTFMARAISADVGIKQSAVRKALRTRDASFARVEASLGATLARIPLSEFNAKGPEPSRGQGRGVSWRIGGTTKRAQDLFIATMESGHRGVFVRVGGLRKSEGAWSKNLPIKERFGPSLGHVFGKKRSAALKEMHASFLKNFDHEMNYRQRQAATVSVSESASA